MSEGTKVFFDAVEKRARTVLACVGIIGCVAIYADFRIVVDRQLSGYEKISANLDKLAVELKSAAADIRENSIRLEHLEREHEQNRTIKK